MKESAGKARAGVELGRFFVLEGIDGSGKSLAAMNICKELRRAGRKCAPTREPTDGFFGTAARTALGRRGLKLSSSSMQLLFTLDRSLHDEEFIRPSLARGKDVVSDRYYWSTAAYAGALSLPVKEFLALNRRLFTRPDISILLRVEPHIALQRIGLDGRKNEIYEHEEMLKRVASTYNDLVRRYQREWLVVDASKTAPQVLSEIMSVVKERL